MAEFHTYSPDRVLVSFGGVLINGFANDTFIEVERDEDTFMKYTGSLADVARTRNLNRGAKVTLTLMATAAVNDELSLIALDDENAVDIDTVFSFEIKDISGEMFCHAEISWIQKMPKVERGKESGTIQWVFDCADMEIFPAGNA